MPSLTLITNNRPSELQRVFPHFPYNFLTFRPCAQSTTFEIIEINSNFMDIKIVQKDQRLVAGIIQGEMHWHGMSIALQGYTKSTIVDSTQRIIFDENSKKIIIEFLRPENLIQGIRIVDSSFMESSEQHDSTKILKFWLHGAGNLDIYVWANELNEFSQFLIIVGEHFVEWSDSQIGTTLQSGICKKNGIIKTPLNEQIEYVFTFTYPFHAFAVEQAKKIMQLIHFNSERILLPYHVGEFLSRKLSLLP